MKINIAGLQTQGHPGDVPANLAELDRAAEEAASHHVDLLITNELFITGYDIGPLIVELAQLDLEAAVAAIALRHRIAFIVGMPEHDFAGGAIYNSAFFIDPEGNTVGRYRKSHLFGALDRTFFTAGDDAFAVVRYLGVNVAMMICYDVEFPESVRQAALAGAHLVAVPTAQMRPFEFVADHLIRTRAWENQVFLAYINHDGVEADTTYVGRSSIAAPDGTVLAGIESGTGLIYATVDTAAVDTGQATNSYLIDRRPEMYKPLPHPTDQETHL